MISINGMPRIRGKVGYGEDNKFYFEITVWSIDGLTMLGDEPLAFVGPFDSEADAQKGLREAVEIVCKKAAEASGEKAQGFIDFKNGGAFVPFDDIKH